MWPCILENGFLEISVFGILYNLRLLAHPRVSDIRCRVTLCRLGVFLKPPTSLSISNSESGSLDMSCIRLAHESRTTYKEASLKDSNRLASKSRMKKDHAARSLSSNSVAPHLQVHCATDSSIIATRHAAFPADGETLH